MRTSGNCAVKAHEISAVSGFALHCGRALEAGGALPWYGLFLSTPSSSTPRTTSNISPSLGSFALNRGSKTTLQPQVPAVSGTRDVHLPPVPSGSPPAPFRAGGRSTNESLVASTRTCSLLASGSAAEPAYLMRRGHQAMLSFN